MTAAGRISRIPFPLVFTFALGFWSTVSHGQDDLGSDVSGQEISKGKPSDPHQLKFKIIDEEEEKKKAAAAQKEPMRDSPSSDDEGFKTYVGYPKHQFGVHLEPKKISAAWTYNGATYNFNANALAYGLDYNFIITPRMTVGLDYTHYTVTMPAATANGFTFNPSTANFDDYFAKFRYCFISDSNFERRFCPGIDVGNDSYPVLQFLNQTTMGLANVSDVILGVNGTGTLPVQSLFVVKAIVGYNMGLGIGNSGAMTSKTNSSYYADLLTDWKVGHNQNYQHAVQVGIGIKFRDASLSGNVSNQPTTWDSKVVDESAYLGYTFTM